MSTRKAYVPTEDDIAKAAETLARYRDDNDPNADVHIAFGWVSGALQSLDDDGAWQTPARAIRQARAMIVAFERQREAVSAR